MVIKQIDTTFMQLVLRMDKPYITQNSIDILLPKPGTIEQYAANLIVTCKDAPLRAGSY